MHAMQIVTLLSPDRIACHQDLVSKKRVLEALAGLLATSSPSLTEVEIFDSLLNRERLGSTGLGTGVAIPHGRMNGISSPLGAIITLNSGVDYDAIDHQPVDLLFALLVPEESTEEHLQILAGLAKMFSDRELCTRLRECQDASQLLHLLDDWEPQRATA
jgi:PTS system nitrogen regulatory IIA component